MNKIENDESQILKLNKSYEDENLKNLSKNIGTYTIGKESNSFRKNPWTGYFRKS